MTDLKITLIDPERMGDRIRFLHALDPSYEMTCQIVRAISQLHARVWLYASADYDKDGGGYQEVLRLSDRLSELYRKCSESEPIDDTQLILGSGGLIEAVLENINAIFIELAVGLPERDLSSYLSDIREYLIDSIQDFWSSAGADFWSKTSGVSFSSTYDENKEKVDRYIADQKDDLEKGAVDYLWEEKLLPMIEKAKSAGATVGIGLLLGLGVGVALWLLIRGGKSAAARTPYGRIASAAMKR